jgi:hypothetical protein
MDKIKINIGGVITEMDKETVSKAIEAGELSLNVENAIIYKKEDFETFKTNLANDEYKKGKTAGEEMLIKTLKEQTGLEVEGKKPEVFVNAFKTKILEEAKIEPSKKIQELEADKNKLLQNYQTLEGEYNTFKTTVTEKETKQKKDTLLMSFIPDKDLVVDKDIALVALRTKTGIDISFDEKGNPFLVKGGEMIKDEKTLQPIDAKLFIPQQIEAIGLIKKVTGTSSGGSDDFGGAGTSSYDIFVKEMKNNGIEPGSEKFAVEMNKRIKEKTLII